MFSTLPLGFVWVCHIPHNCRNCDAEVDQFGLHGLTCRSGRGRLLCHDSINNIVKRSLDSAKVPSVLEPSGILRSDNITLILSTASGWLFTTIKSVHLP